MLTPLLGSAIFILQWLCVISTIESNVASWQSHLEYSAVNTGLSWRTPKDGENSTDCLGGCVCTGDYADCSNRNLDTVPDDPMGVDIKTLDVSENKIQEIPDGTFDKYKNLQDLILKNNLLERIPPACLSIKNLKNLQLGSNNISSIDVGILPFPPSLTNLGLEKNKIELLNGDTFSVNNQLAILNLAYNHLTSVAEESFKELAHLQILEMNNNLLTEVPVALSTLPSLERVTLAKNLIESIPDNIFKSLRNLQQIELRGNPIHNFHKNAFVELPSLKKLQLLGSPRTINTFPNLTGTPNLELIHLDRAYIVQVPDDLCLKARKLNTLRLRSNRLEYLPDLTHCRYLQQLDVGLNNLNELPGQPFQTLGKLQDLLLDRNEIKYLSAEVFTGLRNLQILDLEKNNITEIHEDAFLPLNNLKDLNLGQNHFPVLPYQGLKTIIELKAHNNPELKEFPKAESFPHIRIVRPSYAYHCCLFMPSTYEHFVPEYADFGDLTEDVYFPGEIDLSQFGNQTMPSVIWSNTGNLSQQMGKDLSLDLWENFVSGMGYPDVADYDPSMTASFFKPPEGIDCYPAPGPFLPCNDLFDWWTLRCGVWIVFLLALLGNGCVVFVLSFSRSKIDVPRFLVCNLAMADFFMGLYLGFLAVLDASTLGEFRKYAIQWQLSAACEVAGFFGVLSSELSVFTLAVITLERNYAITHAMHLNKRLSLKHAAYIMVGAWSFSILLASLPLFGVSDYRKFAVCLPFETEGAVSKGYVIFLMIINGVAFFILMGCYLKMYCAIRGSQAWNSNDSRIAKRMALLVFTDFICWFPIAFFALTAACGAQLISLEGAKVFTVFVLPLNSCCNPFLYAILTKQFKKDCVMICKAIEESRVTRGIGRCRHSSNFSNRQTPANTNSLNSGSGSGSHTKNSMHCSCNVKKSNKISPRWPIDKLKSLLCGFKDVEELNSQNEWNYQIAEIQQKQQKTKRHASVSSENFSSSRSDSCKQGHGCMPLRFVDHHRRRNSWTVTRKPSQDSNLSSSRNDSAGSNSTQSTNTWRMSRSSVSSDISNPIGRTGSGYSDKSGTGHGSSKFTALARAQALQRQVRGSPLGGIMKQNSASQLVTHGGHAAIMVRGKPKLIRQVAIQDEANVANAMSLGKQVSFKENGHFGDPSCPIHHDGGAGTNYSRYKTLYAKLTESSHEDEESEPEASDVDQTNQSNPAAKICNDKGNTASPLPNMSFPPTSFQPSPLTSGFVPRKLSTISSKGSIQRESNPALNLVNSNGDSSPLCEDSSDRVASPKYPSLAQQAKKDRDNKRLSLDNLVPPRSVDSQRRVSLGTGLYNPSNDPVSKQAFKHGSLTNLAEPKYGPQKCTSENALLALQSKYGYSFKSAVTGSGVVLSKSDNLLNERLLDIPKKGVPSVTHTESQNLLPSPSGRRPVDFSNDDDDVFESIDRPPTVIINERQGLLSPEPPGSVASHSSSRRTPTIEEEPEELEKLL